LANSNDLYPNLTRHRDSVAAISDSGNQLTYGELSDFANVIRGVIAPRSLVFVLCENTIGCFAGCTALLCSHAVPLLLDAAIDRQFLEELIAIYRPNYVFVPDRYQGEFSSHKVTLHRFEYLILQTRSNESILLHSDLALLVSTSGSTGSPKLVRQSYRNLATNGKSIVDFLGIDSHERPITTLPMHYTYGFSIVNSHLMAGSTLLLTKRTLFEKKFWIFFRQEQATSFGGVPYTFEMLKRLRFHQMNLPSLKTITQAGGRLSNELVREFAEYAANKNIRFFVMYGQTEATARMSYLPHEYAIAKCGSIGIAVPGGELFLVDDKGSVIDDCEQEGELAFRGDNVTMGYAECRQDLSKGPDRGGILYTGDIARRDQDGFYYITGRKSRFIKLFGNRVNLDEVERLIKTLDVDCACCGYDDRMLVCLLESSREMEVQHLLSSKTGIHSSAFKIKVIPEIPKNEAGKILYAKLLNQVDQ